MTIKTALFATIASLGMVSVALAAPVTGQISLGGYAESSNSVGMGAATGLNFASGPAGAPTISGSSGSLYSFGAGYGSFAGLTCSSTAGSCGTIKDVANFAAETATTSFLTLNTGGGPTISFDLTSITGVAHGTDLYGGSVVFTANGIINFTGYDSTQGTFILTAQGNNIVSFSATTLASAVPEPASFALLGGSLAAVGLLRRKKAA